MKSKLVLTQVPVCNIDTHICKTHGYTCECCSKATDIEVLKMFVPENQAVPVSVMTNHDTLVAGDKVIVRAEFSHPIDITKLFLKSSEDLKLIQKQLSCDKRVTRLTFKLNDNLAVGGMRNIVVGYLGINRVARVQCLRSLVRILNVEAIPNIVGYGDPFLVKIALNRSLDEWEPEPQISYPDSFEIINNVTISPIDKNVYLVNMSSKDVDGAFELTASLDQIIQDPISKPKSVEVTVMRDVPDYEGSDPDVPSVDPIELDYAEKLDIDKIFPELGNVSDIDIMDKGIEFEDQPID